MLLASIDFPSPQNPASINGVYAYYYITDVNLYTSIRGWRCTHRHTSPQKRSLHPSCTNMDTQALSLRQTQSTAAWSVRGGSAAGDYQCGESERLH